MSENGTTNWKTVDLEQSTMADKDKRIELEAEIEELQKQVAINPEDYNLGGRTREAQDREDLEAWSRKREALDQKRQELVKLLKDKK